MAHDLEAEQRLRELLTDPAWELPAWPDAADRVRAAARRQRQRSAGLAATAAAVCAVVVCAVVISTGLSALRLGHSAPGAAGQAYSLPTANAAGFPADVHPRTELGPLLRRGSRCPDPAGVSAFRRTCAPRPPPSSAIWAPDSSLICAAATPPTGQPC